MVMVLAPSSLQLARKPDSDNENAKQVPRKHSDQFKVGNSDYPGLCHNKQDFKQCN